jgi:photosystem II stability/assembly factor-like uncharacterized protein
MTLPSNLRAILTLFPACALLAVPATAQVDLEPFANMTARSVGPSGQGGRVNAIDALISNPNVIYVGAAAGGVWRSTNGGTSWEPIFDDQPVQSIGAIAVNQSNPDVIWVGTGEGSPRNSVNHGNGIYKSIDGGESWTHLGLADSRAIHRILLHPTNPDVAYLAVLGTPFGDSEERGVYRTRDGGTSWERTLFVDARTGAADLVMDPRNPDKLIASMWSHRRQPWTFTSGGPGSGIHVSYDGGDTWTQRTADDGLPSGELGRIGLAIAPSDANIVYALVEAKKSVLLRSEDGGRSFETVNSEDGVNPRPFYYADIFVDPANENRLYRLASPVDVSEDGGKSFDTWLSGSVVHVDHHAWWIHPEQPDLIINGNDGGAALSRDRGRTWQVFHNLPIGQFYHVNVDMETPYNIYGGAQDNDSFRGPSYAWNFQGIQNHQWENLGCCADGFDMAPDPRDGRYGYAMYQGGALMRYDRASGHLRRVAPTHPEEADLRFNWNAALALDPIRPGRVWFGSQFLHVTDDDGLTWRTVSPDLTTNDPVRQNQMETGGLTIDDSGAENNTTIVSIAPSPVQEGVVWVGTDDGNVQLTRDGGDSWTNLVDEMPGAPKGAWVPQIHASSHSAGEALAVLEDHRRDDWTPYVYHTTDFGESWRRVAADVDGYALSVVQDPEAPGLIFVGTDRGLWFSVDGGDAFQRWDNGVPATPVRDMVIHPREHDLVMGTFGRSFLVLDDIRPLRTLASGGAPERLHVYPASDAHQVVIDQQPGTVFPGDFLYQGENRDFGARIRYWVPAGDDEEASDEADDEGDDETAEGAEAGDGGDNVTVRILADGSPVRRLTGSAEVGVQQIEWRMDRAGVRGLTSAAPDDPDDARQPGGPLALPGEYIVQVILGADTVEAPLRLLPDPRIGFDAATARRVDTLQDQLLEARREATGAADRIRDAQKTVERIQDVLDDRDGEAADSLSAHGDRIDAGLDSLYFAMAGEPIQGFRNQPELLNSRLGAASQDLGGGRWAEPSQAAMRSLERAEAAVAEMSARVETFFATRWAEYRSAVEASGIGLFDGG